MKRLATVVLLLFVTVPAWSAKKITVPELRDMLVSMHQANKSDEEVAAALKQVQMSEMLDRNTMNSMGGSVPGQLTTEQLYVLEARSAMLAPQASEMPATPAPDAAGQKAILDKAEAYMAKTYDLLPALTVTKTTRRFQDNAEVAAPASGSGSKDSAIVNPWQFVRYINVNSATIASDHGVEKAPTEKDKTPWGINRMIAVQEPDPSLSQIYQQAKDAGVIKWVRWETVDGKPAAVFSFDVPKKKSHMNVNICCFPEASPVSLARTTSDTVPQDDARWHNFKSTVPFRGEFFIDAETGVVERMITLAGLKSSDVVHQQDTRIDYGPVTVGNKKLIVPVTSVIGTEVVPNGDTSSSKPVTRCTWFTSEYKDYQLAK